MSSLRTFFVMQMLYYSSCSKKTCKKWWELLSRTVILFRTYKTMEDIFVLRCFPNLKPEVIHGKVNNQYGFFEGLSVLIHMAFQFWNTILATLFELMICCECKQCYLTYRLGYLNYRLWCWYTSKNIPMLLRLLQCSFCDSCKDSSMMFWIIFVCLIYDFGT